MTIGDEKKTLGAGDVVVVNRGLEHELYSEGGMTFVEALAPVLRDHVPDAERDSRRRTGNPARRAVGKRQMSRPVTLFTGQWGGPSRCRARRHTRQWGFDGLELACWGDHFEVDRALADDAYCRERRELLERYGLGCWALGAHLVGQAVCDRIDARHRAILPPDVWGDGDPRRASAPQSG